MSRVTADGRPKLPLDGVGVGRRLAGAVLACALLGTLAWTIVWHILHSAPVLDAVFAPWAAPVAYLTWPAAHPLDPRLAWSGLIATVLAFVTLGAVFAPRAKAIHGDARFARMPEVKAMGLFASTGLLLGRTRGPLPRYLRHAGPLHALLVAPTRSGKGVGVVTPNLLSWPGSAVVLDVKDENFQNTSGFRERHGSRVFRFAPGDPEKHTCRFNPLDAVRRDRERRIGDLQQMAHLLTPEGVAEQKMWNQEARSLFVGIGLYILDTPGLPLTFGQVSRILQTNANLGDAFKAVIEGRGPELDPSCVNILANFANKAPKEQSGVKSTLTGALELWNDPIVDAATSASDFSFDELRRVPTTIYVSVTLDQLERLAFLLNLFFQQLIGVTSRRQPGPDEPHQILVLVDEFASLGRMDLVVDKMPFMAGFGVKLLLVIQGLAQLDRLYGSSGRELVLANAGLQIFFASNDDQTSRYISERLGTFTETQKSRSRSTPLMGGHGGSVSTGTHYHARELMKPQEVRALDGDAELIFVESRRPVRAAKIVYYADKTFTARLQPPVAVAPITVAVHPPFAFPPAGGRAAPPASPEPSLRELYDEAAPNLRAEEKAELRALARQMPSLKAHLPDLDAEPPAEPAEPEDAADFTALLVGELKREGGRRSRGRPRSPGVVGVGKVNLAGTGGATDASGR